MFKFIMPLLLLANICVAQQYGGDQQMIVAPAVSSAETQAVSAATETDPRMLVQKPSACQIEITSFSEIRTSTHHLQFTAGSTQKTYKYHWTLYFKNGVVLHAQEPEPVFDFSVQNELDRMVLKIETPQCTRTITKKFEGMPFGCT